MESNNYPPPVRDRRPGALGDMKVLPDELICALLDFLSPRDVARLSCVSTVMYIFCNEEPLWMSLALSRANGPIQYNGSWKKTALFQENVPAEYIERCGNPLRFDGFSSLFLYRRIYRCHTTLNMFNFDTGNVERKKDMSLEEFSDQYGGAKPVLLTGLADTWPARNTWTIQQLLEKYGDTAFKISQRSSRKISMKFEDYVSYMNLQHDEDPLYIFDEKFGETAPSLLKDYTVPHLFHDDFFEVLDRESRPPYRWFIIGPERSGASWHVDPALTSAWNTLLCGRKRWALYPPGRVPLSVTVHVNEDDGDVNIETPSSLQWWLDFYPLLADEDKPIECTQLPGETIYVPSGWWHCVLNLEPTIAVTQNFVNAKNFEHVCLDMAPGYRHKGVSRAGLLALDESDLEDVKKKIVFSKEDQTHPNLTRKEKRLRIQDTTEQYEPKANGAPSSYDLWKQEFSYDIKFLAMFLDKERDHYNSPWSSGNSIGPRELREWLYNLWIGRPGIRELVWKGACLALNADKWLDCLMEISSFHNLPSATDDERLPVGSGSNPVYLLPNCAVKIYVEGGLEASMYCLGTELEFYSLLHEVNSSLLSHVPEVLASGIVCLENGSYKIEPWDGRGVPKAIGKCNWLSEKSQESSLPFGVWSKKQFEYRNAGITLNERLTSTGRGARWPFLVTKRCKGQIFAQLRDALSWEEALNLASFLGQKLRELHLLPYPILKKSTLSKTEQNPFANGSMDDAFRKLDIPPEWELFIRVLSKKKENIKAQLKDWGDSIPDALVQKVDEYIPDDLTKFLGMHQDGERKISKACSWIHSDIMDDNVHLEPYQVESCSNGNIMDASDKDGKSWRPSHILDFSDLSIGDRLYDVIPIYLDVFRGDPSLLKQFLESYKLPLLKTSEEFMEADGKYGRLSYHAMCYCILHEENILGAIFSMWKELRAAKSWEEVELTVWGELNNYNGIS